MRIRYERDLIKSGTPSTKLTVTPIEDIEDDFDKGTTFGVPYGASPECVAKNTGLPLEEASRWITRFFAKAIVLKFWLDGQRAHAFTYGWTKSLRGRKRFYLLPTKEAETEAKTAEERKEAKDAREKGDAHIMREAGNQPIQSSCVDLLKSAMVEIYLSGLLA